MNLRLCQDSDEGEPFLFVIPKTEVGERLEAYVLRECPALPWFTRLSHLYRSLFGSWFIVSGKFKSMEAIFDQGLCLMS